MLFARFKKQGEINDLDTAITCFQKAVDLTTSDHPDLDNRFGALINMLAERLKIVEGRQDVDAIIKYSKRAVDIPDLDRLSLAKQLNNLSIELVNLFEVLKRMDILDAAVNTSQIAVDITPSGDPSLPNKLNSLAKALGTRYHQANETNDLETSIFTARRSVEITHPDDPDLVIPLTSLASLLCLRYDSLGREQDLDDAILHIIKALDVSTGLPETVIVLSGLADKLENRYKRTRETKDLDAAITYAQKALDITPHDHPTLVDCMASVHNKLTFRYMATDKEEDLNAILIHARRAIDMTASDLADLIAYLHALSKALGRHHTTTGNTELLETAVTLGQRALDIAPLDEPKVSSLLEDLSELLYKQNLSLGNTKDLEQGIIYARRAVALSHVDDQDLVLPLVRLGVFLARRYDRTLRSEDLDEAIVHTRKAVNIKSKDPRVAAAALSGLSNRLVTLQKRTGSIKDLEDAIAYGREALDILPADDEGICGYLHDLSVAILDRYVTKGDMKDLNTAMEYCRIALEKLPPHDMHRSHSHFLYTNGTLFLRRYVKEGRIEDLEAAIAETQRSIDLTKPKDPELSNRLCSLGVMFVRRDGYGNAALTCFIKARNCQTASPQAQVNAGRWAADILVRQGNLREARSMADGLIGLLPMICNRSLNRADQQHAVSLTAGLASAACSLSLMTENDPERALGYLENGRGLIIGYMIDGRGEISELQKDFPAKAKEFDVLRIKASMTIDAEEQSDIQQLMLERVDAARALEDCVAEIRRLPGYERFLLLPSSDVLRSYANEGPIVVVNASVLSSHAIIVLTTGIQVVQLPDLRDLAKIDSLQWRSVRSDTRHAQVLETQVDQEYQKVLSRLWSDCVRLVLDAIGTSGKPEASILPRIWWMGTGFADMLPSHAAGDHSAGSVNNTFSRVISSYTPSIKVLRHAREKANLRLGRHSVLLVTMPETPGATPLPGVEDEADIISEVVKPSVHPTQRLRQPSAAEVIRILENFTIAHFACHGSSDLHNPSNSYLALQGPSVAVPDRLTVQKVSDAKLTGGWLAYLSACSTAENNVSDLADESLHLASSFQVAGFAHVVASMWPSDDQICVEVATIFYQELFRKGGVKLGNRGVAEALHTAVMAIRQKNMHRPHLWAQYIHSGA
jgi:tetratricopeptide (TPR) repeat protein